MRKTPELTLMPRRPDQGMPRQPAAALLTSRLMTQNVHVGSAAADAPAHRGWLLGHFMPAGDVRHSKDVEVKWGVHPRGEQRAQWVTAEQRTAMIVLVSGRFRIELPGQDVVLHRAGDYVVFHGTGHSWHAEEDSVVLGVRWPSVPGYALPDQSSTGKGS